MPQPVLPARRPFDRRPVRVCHREDANLTNVAGHVVELAEFIDRALGVAPHLRRHIVGVLAGLPDAAAFGPLSDTEAETRRRRVEETRPKTFDILVQATYTGYYSHPQVMAALGVSTRRHWSISLTALTTRYWGG